MEAFLNKPRPWWFHLLLAVLAALATGIVGLGFAYLEARVRARVAA